MARSLSDDSANLCVDVSANFANINHLLKCKNRHFFKSDSIPKEPQFTENTQCLVEVLRAVSPIWFDVRIHKYKDLNGDWCTWNSVEQFDQFREDLNEFHETAFSPVKDLSEVNEHTLFVLRKGDQFMRCIILNVK